MMMMVPCDVMVVRSQACRRLEHNQRARICMNGLAQGDIGQTINQGLMVEGAAAVCSVHATCT